MNQQKTLWLSTLLLFLALIISHGMFLPIAVTLCGGALGALFLPQPKCLENFSLDQFLNLSLIAFGLIPLLQGVFYPPLLIYPEDLTLYNAMKIFQVAISIVAFLNFLKPKHTFLWLVIALSSAALFLVLFISPHPIIDVWNIHEACASAIAHGKNPYTIDLPNPYPANIQDSMTPGGMSAVYLPGIYLLMAPLSILHLDTRMAGIFALFGIAFLLYLFGKRSERLSDFQKLLLPTLFLANPLNLFLIEQGWNDPIGTFFFLLLIFSLTKSKIKITPIVIAVTGTLLSKQYFWPITLMVLIWGTRHTLITWKQLLISLVPTFGVLAIFTFIDWRNFWGSLYGLHFLKENGRTGFLDVRWNSLSITVYLKIFTGLDLSILSTLIVTGHYATISFFILKTEHLKSADVFFKVLTALMFAVVFFSPTANFNYYFAIWTFLFFLLSSGGKNSESKLFQRLNLETGIFVFTRALIIAASPILTDVGYYQSIVQKISEHAIPYKDFNFEYPPLSLAILMITKWVTMLSPQKNTFIVFRFWFQITLFGFDFLVFRWLKAQSKEALSRTYLFLPLFLYPLWYDRLDLIVGLLLLVAGVSLFKEKTFRSLCFIFISGLFKIVPIIELMVFVSKKIETLNFSLWKNEKRTSFLFIFSLLLSCMFPLAWAQIFHYHSDRPIQAESTWSTLDYVYRTFTGSGDFNTFVSHSYGSYGINPYLDLETISTYALPVGLGLLSIFFFFNLKNRKFEIFHMLLPLMLFMILSRVFSPQYLIWIVPLVGVSNFDLKQKLDRWILLLTYLICGISSYLLANYLDFTQIRMDLWMYLTVRNLACAGIFILLLMKIRKSPKIGA